MGIDEGFDVVTQITDQRRWEMAMDVIRRHFQNSGILKEHSQDFEDIEAINMFEATESLNFGTGANHWSWAGFTSVDEEGTKGALKEVLEKLRADPSDYRCISRRDELMTYLKALRMLTPGLHNAVSRYIAEKTGFERKYLRVPILFEFTVGEHPSLPRYARHFRKFSSKVSGRCGDAAAVIADVFAIMQRVFGKRAVVNTGDLYIEYMYDLAEERGETRDCKYPPPSSLAADGTAAAFYRTQPQQLMNSKLPSIMLVLNAAKRMGLSIPSPACARIFDFLPRASKAEA